MLTNPASLAFIVIAIVLVLLFAWGCAHVAAPHQRGRIARLALLAGAAWLLLSWRVAESGVLRRWNAVPPPFFGLLIAILGIGGAIALTPLGRRIAFGVPLWVLILVQSFRLPLELAMHRLATLGIMPEQMTFTGLNFDIVTGSLAPVVAWLLRSGYGGRPLAMAWNVVGSLLLVNVVTIAVLSTPRFRFFGEARMNTFVTYTPYIWLPAVMVVAALAGHLLIFRRLLTKA